MTEQDVNRRSLLGHNPDGIEWGPEIPVNGKRPEWLADDARVWVKWPEWSMFSNGIQVYTIERSMWADVTALRLPADHPHYQQRSDADDALQLCRDIRESGSLYYAKEVLHLYKRACEIAVRSVRPIDRFMAAHPTADRATAEKALEWGREG